MAIRKLSLLRPRKIYGRGWLCPWTANRRLQYVALTMWLLRFAWASTDARYLVD
jgi:hypothetical protein